MPVNPTILVLFVVGLGRETPQEETPPPPPPPQMQCETGPVRRTFGGTEWIVWSCDDQASMVVVSAEGNPASPFYFFLKPTGSSYIIRGEGNGNKQASDAAGDALSKMTLEEFAGLLAATKRTTP